MRKVSAKDAKYNFGKLIDLARAAPIAVTKYDRPVIASAVARVSLHLDRIQRATPSAPRRGRRHEDRPQHRHGTRH
jgi:hypothetical protein